MPTTATNGDPHLTRISLIIVGKAGKDAGEHMGIGRRNFLKFAAMALGGIVLDPLEAIAVNDNFYINMRLGLGFERPEGWHFDAFKDFGTLLKGQIAEGIQPEDEEEFRKDQTSTLVAVISKYGDKYSGFAPSITVFKNEEDRADFGSLDELIKYAMIGFSSLLKDFTVISPPEPLELSNCECIRLKARWVFQHERIPSTLIEDEILVIDQDPVLYTIHLYDAPSIGEVAQPEFAGFVGSLRLA
jgi:hypothetical protein